MSGAVRSGCVVVEAMQTADKYLRVLIFALLMKQLDFELYTKHQWLPQHVSELVAGQVTMQKPTHRTTRLFDR